MESDDEDLALSVVFDLEYAMECGDPSALPDLDELRWALARFIALKGDTGYAHLVRKLKFSIKGPDVTSYAEIARLFGELMSRLYRDDADSTTSEDDLPF